MSAKSLDNHNRFRSETIGFRVSPEENKQIEVAISLSGQTKQEYIISKLLDRQISVHGNSKIHKAVYDQLCAVLDELRRIEAGQQVDDELLDNIRLVSSVIDTLYVRRE